MQPFISLRSVAIATALISLSGCGKPPVDSAFFNRGGPEALLDVSSEVVNLSVASSQDVRDLSTWLEKDRPTRAELNCAEGENRCAEVQKVLDLQGVPVALGSANDASVTLVYERILARDCNQRYVDNPANYYNTYHPSFGCSVSANMVLQVTDKQEFVSPNLSDDPSAVRGVTDMRRAYKPRPEVKPYSVDDALTNKAKTGG
jgi:type IV pilus biogenesis protein CpaD/CtpE